MSGRRGELLESGVRVMLTGAAGFIGSSVARHLRKRGCSVTGLVRSNSTAARLNPIANEIGIVNGDFHSQDDVADALAAATPEILVHAAWHTTPGIYLRHASNLRDLQASLDLFEAARRAGCRRIVGIGTCLEYDTEYGWLAEGVPLRPKSLYASAKAALFLAASGWARENGVSFSWARLFYQYGPGEDPHRLVPSVIASLLAGLPIATTSGEQVRDYLHVEDVGSAIASIAMSDVDGPINIGSGYPVPVRDVVLAIERQTHRAGLVQFGARASEPADPGFICADTRRIRTTVGWQPTIALEDGIAETIRWWSGELRHAPSQSPARDQSRA